jgi:hypothetical protein
MIIVLSGPRPTVTRSSTSSYVVPLIMSFGICPLIYAETHYLVERFF